MTRRAAPLFFVLATASVPAQAQLPTPSSGAVTSSAPAAPSASSAAAPLDSEAGCVEKLPPGKVRPTLTEAFPARGLSGHALPLVVTLGHGPAETVLPTGFRFQPDAAEAKAPEVAAGPRAEVPGGVPVGHRPAVEHDLACVGIHAGFDALRVGLTGRDGPRRAAVRRPRHIARRGAVAGIEEARRPALGRGLAGQLGAHRSHPIATFLACARDRAEIVHRARRGEATLGLLIAG